MVLTYDQESELEVLKHANKIAFEKLRHSNKCVEITLELEYARLVGGEIHGCNDTGSNDNGSSDNEGRETLHKGDS